MLIDITEIAAIIITLLCHYCCHAYIQATYIRYGYAEADDSKRHSAPLSATLHDIVAARAMFLRFTTYAEMMRDHISCRHYIATRHFSLFHAPCALIFSPSRYAAAVTLYYAWVIHACTCSHDYWFSLLILIFTIYTYWCQRYSHYAYALFIITALLLYTLPYCCHWYIDIDTHIISYHYYAVYIFRVNIFTMITRDISHYATRLRYYIDTLIADYVIIAIRFDTRLRHALRRYADTLSAIIMLTPPLRHTLFASFGHYADTLLFIFPREARFRWVNGLSICIAMLAIAFVFGLRAICLDMMGRPASLRLSSPLPRLFFLFFRRCLHLLCCRHYAMPLILIFRLLRHFHYASCHTPSLLIYDGFDIVIYWCHARDIAAVFAYAFHIITPCQHTCYYDAAAFAMLHVAAESYALQLDMLIYAILLFAIIIISVYAINTLRVTILRHIANFDYGYMPAMIHMPLLFTLFYEIIILPVRHHSLPYADILPLPVHQMSPPLEEGHIFHFTLPSRYDIFHRGYLRDAPAAWLFADIIRRSCHTPPRYRLQHFSVRRRIYALTLRVSHTPCDIIAFMMPLRRRWYASAVPSLPALSFTSAHLSCKISIVLLLHDVDEVRFLHYFCLCVYEILLLPCYISLFELLFSYDMFQSRYFQELFTLSLVTCFVYCSAARVSSYYFTFLSSFRVIVFLRAPVR